MILNKVDIWADVVPNRIMLEQKAWERRRDIVGKITDCKTYTEAARRLGISTTRFKSILFRIQRDKKRDSPIEEWYARVESEWHKFILALR